MTCFKAEYSKTVFLHTILFSRNPDFKGTVQLTRRFRLHPGWWKECVVEQMLAHNDDLTKWPTPILLGAGVSSTLFNSTLNIVNGMRGWGLNKLYFHYNTGLSKYICV